MVAVLLFLVQAWVPVVPGAERMQLKVEDTTVELIRFDLERFRADVIMPPAPQTAAQAGEQAKAAIAVNGGFFDKDQRPLGLRIASGRERVPLRPRVDWGVLAVRDQRANIVHSVDYKRDPAITAAVQVGPRLIAGGVALKLKPQRARRTVVALDKEGRFLTVVVASGAVTAGALAGALAALSFDTALMLDGGPSTQLRARVGGLVLDVPGGYGVPDLLVVRPR
jgi:hypothetical protein